MLVGALLLCPVSVGAEATSVNVADFGAVSGGEKDCTAAFEKALASGARLITVPTGRFAVKQIVLPAGATLAGAGNSAVIVPAADASSPLLSMGDRTTVRDIAFDGKMTANVCISTGAVKGVRIDSVTIENFNGAAIVTSHTDGMTIRDCAMSKVSHATMIQFSSRIKVIGNTATDCVGHGFQFWGNWKWSSKQCFDLQFIGNYCKDTGATGIFGCGAVRAIVANNIVDGANDVGIDLEWCDDSAITGNVVRNVINSGISLFFACKGVSITGNTVINDRPISETEAKRAWWVRSGIWLTYPNRDVYKKDFGHRDISIVGNTILCADGERRAMWIGSEADNITVSGNTLSGGKIWQGGHHMVQPMRLVEVPADAVLRAPPAEQAADTGKSTDTGE